MRCPTCEQTVATNASLCAACGTSVVPASTAQSLVATPWQPTAQLAAAAPAMSASFPIPTQQANVTVQVAPVVVVGSQVAGPGCLIRGLYSLVVGWWLSQVWILAAWFLNAAVVGLPFGLMMLNRLPQVVTLKAVQTQTNVSVQNGVVILSQGAQTQQSFVLRALYFAVVGWWASLFWVEVAWLPSISVLGIPLAFWMFNRTPAVTTLARR